MKGYICEFEPTPAELLEPEPEPEPVPVAFGELAEAPEVAPVPVAALVAAIPSSDRGTPLLIVGIVAQLLEDGVMYAELGVTVSPTVYGVPLITPVKYWAKVENSVVPETVAVGYHPGGSEIQG